MKQGSFGHNYMPWSNVGKTIVVRSPDEIKKMILGSDEVKEVMHALVRERAKVS
jgi:hypothetical protein